MKDNGRNSKPTPKIAEVRFQLSAGFFIKLWQKDLPIQRSGKIHSLKT